MSEDLEKQFEESEKHRAILEKMRNEQPTLQEKIASITERLELAEEILKKVGESLDQISIRAEAVYQLANEQKEKLAFVHKQVVAGIKDE